MSAAGGAGGLQSGRSFTAAEASGGVRRLSYMRLYPAGEGWRWGRERGSE